MCAICLKQSHALKTNQVLVYIFSPSTQDLHKIKKQVIMKWEVYWVERFRRYSTYCSKDHKLEGRNQLYKLSSDLLQLYKLSSAHGPG